MAGSRHQLLDIQIAVAKGRARLGLATLVRFFGLLGAMNGPDAAAPPPATALIIMEAPGPSDDRNDLTSSRLVACDVPGNTGTPQRSASIRARTLSPRSSSTSGRGPTNLISCSAHRR